MPTSSKGNAAILSGLTVLLTAMLIGGCEEYRAQSDAVVAEHGNAVAHNIAVHTINPWPPASRDAQIDVNGERILIGAERYKANKSIEPKGLATQKVSSGSASGGGASAGGGSP